RAAAYASNPTVRWEMNSRASTRPGNLASSSSKALPSP
ncbi:hypothetical protein STIAU_6969, partial [Stigmatella aurantiaca DW4/3-1]